MGLIITNHEEDRTFRVATRIAERLARSRMEIVGNIGRPAYNAQLEPAMMALRIGMEERRLDNPFLVLRDMVDSRRAAGNPFPKAAAVMMGCAALEYAEGVR